MTVIDLTLESGDEGGEREVIEVSDSDSESTPASSASRVCGWTRQRREHSIASAARRYRRQELGPRRLSGLTIPRRDRDVADSGGAGTRALLLSAADSMLPEGAEVLTDLPTTLAAPKKGPGMRSFEMKALIEAPSFKVTELPFDVSEITAFNRKTWTPLATHRYKFDSAEPPITKQDQEDCTKKLLRDLLRVVKVKEWHGLEPEITYPQLPNVAHAFVDITFRNATHHILAREPSPSLNWKYGFIRPWLHAAYVAHPYFIVQFAYPRDYPQDHKPFANKVAEALQASAFGRLGMVVAGWVLPKGFPHSPDFVPTRGEREESPEFILLLKSSAQERPDVTLPAYLPVGPDHVKIFWDGRPKLCDYCKSATDGHLADECQRRPARE